MVGKRGGRKEGNEGECFVFIEARDTPMLLDTNAFKTIPRNQYFTTKSTIKLRT